MPPAHPLSCLPCDSKSAVSFIRRHEAHGKSVYVHCRAGHGRSAAAVFAWLLYKDPIVDVETLNADFCKLRNVRRTLWKQTNLRQLHARLIQKGTLLGMEDEPGDPPPPKLIDDNWCIDSEDL
jgi:protein-tyrosine phosphatase